MLKEQPAVGEDTRGSTAVARAEPLEPRRLLAGIEGGVLVARGTGGSDSFALLREGFDNVRITTNGVSQSFDMDDFASVRLEGLGGNDTFDLFDALTSPVVRPVSVLGGDRNDRVRLHGFAQANSDGGAGIDTTEVFDSLLDMINMGAAIENLVGAGNHVRTVNGNGLGNHIQANGGSNGVTLNGIGGNDTLIGGPESDLLDGGDKGDSLVGNGGDDTLLGGANVANDTLLGGVGNDLLDGGLGTADAADGGPGDDIIVNAELTTAPPRFAIVNRILTVEGSWGQDLITIERTGIDDVIVRVNEIARQFDMDVFDGIVLRGNIGFDDLRVLDPIVAGSLVRKVTLEGGAGNDSLRGNVGDDVLRGGDGNDQLFASGGRDALFGQSGNDTLDGGPGPDFLDGGDGDDALDAQNGIPSDTVLGGNGADRALLDPGDAVSGVETFL